MAYQLQPGVHVSLDNVTWYKLTDHNRQPIDISTELIESQSRMANGTMRKYVVNKKDKISTSWKFLPTRTSDTFTATYNSGGLSGTSSLTVTNSTILPYNRVRSGQTITGTGIQSGTIVTTISISSDGSTTTVGLSKNTTSNVSGIITFSESLLVDGDTKGASWLTAFYNANSGLPIKLKIIQSKHNDPSFGQAPSDSTYVSALTGVETYDVFMTNISKTVVKRTSTTDFVDMTIEFTEI